jgi:hypothetical protein
MRVPPKICEMAFKAMGLSANRAVDYKDGYDFMVEVRCA